MGRGLECRRAGIQRSQALAAWVMMSGVESRPPAVPCLVVTTRAARHFVWGLGPGCVLVFAVVVARALAGWLTLFEWVPSRISASGRTAYVNAVLILTAAVEELAVRGHPLQVLARARVLAVAIGAASLVFA